MGRERLECQWSWEIVRYFLKLCIWELFAWLCQGDGLALGVGDDRHLTVPPSSAVEWGGMIHLSFDHRLTNFPAIQPSLWRRSSGTHIWRVSGRRNGYLNSLWLWGLSGQYTEKIGTAVNVCNVYSNEWVILDSRSEFSFGSWTSFVTMNVVVKGRSESSFFRC